MLKILGLLILAVFVFELLRNVQKRNGAQNPKPDDIVETIDAQQCPHCGTYVNDGETVCPQCSHQL